MDVFLAYSIFKLRLLSAWSCHEHGYGELTEIFASVRVCWTNITVLKLICLCLH